MKISRLRDEWLAGLAAFLVGCCAAFTDLPVIISHFMVDDSFYYLEIARNVAGGNGFTFDGLHATNGFQPLYQFLIVPVFWLTRDSAAGIHAVKALEAILLGIAVTLLFRLVFQLARSRAAAWLAVAVLFLPGPYGHPFSKGLFIGMESGVNAVMIAWLLLMWLQAMSTKKGRGFFLLYGLVIGLTFLARLDNIFLIAGIAAHSAYVWGKRSEYQTRDLVLTGAVGLAVAGSYLLWNDLQFGSILPISGRVQLMASGNRSAALLADGWLAWAGNVLWFISNLKPVSALPLIGLFGLPALFLLQRLSLASDRPVYAARHLPVLMTLWASSLLRISYYSLFQQYPRSGHYWYYVQEVAVFAICAGLAAAWIFARLRLPRIEAVAPFVSLSVLAVGAAGILNTQPVFEWELASYTAARQLGRYIDDDDVLGAKDAGVLGYFLPNPVINLDGLVNDRRFYEYLKDGRERQYILEEDIVYLVNLSDPSSADMLTTLMGSGSLELVYRADTPVASYKNWVYKLYRVVK